MMPSLRPVLPLFDFTALRWGSSIRLRPRHVFHVQRFLFHGTKSEKEKFPYYTEVPYLNRETVLRRLSFPREYMPYWSRIWWTTRWAPLLLIMSPVLLIRFCLYRPWHLPMVNEGVEGNSRAARLLRVLKSIIRLLNIVIQPWGLITLGRGPSMQPTIPEGLAPGYYSYAYVDRRDIRRGDVVAVIPPKIHDRKGLLGKRIAALGGERIRVTRCGPLKIPYKIVHVPFGHCFLLGDNPQASTDSRTFGPVPIESVLAKMQWRLGLDGVSRIDHHQHPWLQNKAIEHLPPADGGLPDGEDLTPHLKKNLKMVPRANGKPLPSSSPPKKHQKAKKQRKDPRKKIEAK